MYLVLLGQYCLRCYWGAVSLGEQKAEARRGLFIATVLLRGSVASVRLVWY